ncbi:ATP-dependent DNA helicase RecG [Treponema medium]|uniref:ATP-dependent DNA helicase RecG n=2 Tax=Treponema medium TaxID=58231 RepID=A0AA87TF02_TREMD|nr:ATP-dependent DNA helicase RecG [Treponema medium]EPF28954.1 ATP-dependent DNA helicase RecG [Treponema medium ATCC 700293]QSH97319.1 ATP-dependent DNA helicase RecG [Treponema medium]
MLIGEIQTPVSNLYGAGKTTVEQLSRLGVSTVGDLLRLWPRAWEDRSRYNTLSEWNKFHKLNVPVTVMDQQWFGYGRMKTLKLIVCDSEGIRGELACFNRPFLEKSFPEGTKALVYGSFSVKYGAIQSSSFDIEKYDTAERRILPVYPLTQGLTQTKLRKLIDQALNSYARGIDSELPAEVLNKYGYPDKRTVLFAMHRPASMQDAGNARTALIFEEFFLYEAAVGMRALERRGVLPRTPAQAGASEGAAQSAGPLQYTYSPLQKELLSRLPFTLTADQQAVIAEINADLDGTAPAARLIQGDVGSGKTLVAFLACLKVIEGGGQAALMAPTELLARQHADNAAKLLEPLGVRLAFLTGNLKAAGRSQLLQQLASGNIDLIIGTHALFSAQTLYKNLRMVVIDEQHRFGVLQRSAIIQKGIDSGKKAPHFLMMSATPIPRTLALSMFGDLDISVIKTMPPGRKPVITYVAPESKAEKVYYFIGQDILAGKQAYFVYPIIEDSDTLSLKSAEDMFAELTRDFPHHRLALLHSKVPEDEARTIMQEFRSGTIHILVATSVIEVGVDVPNATCMVIEHADRFGLSALHQLRGRIGRGSEQSYCFLLYGKNITETGMARLKVMASTTDGFVIAEEDLKLRGPGDIGGVEQSGYCGFELADPIRDFALLEKARIAAFEMLAAQRGLTQRENSNT